MKSPTSYLVTGGAGFIGSHLCEELVQSGHEVIAIDDLSTGQLDNIASLQGRPNFHFARAAIENQVVLDRLTSEVDVVVHLAAAVVSSSSLNDPYRRSKRTWGVRSAFSKLRSATVVAF